MNKIKKLISFAMCIAIVFSIITVGNMNVCRGEVNETKYENSEVIIEKEATVKVVPNLGMARDIGCVAGDGVALRKGPGKQYTVLERFYGEEKVYIKKQQGRWCYLQRTKTGTYGWVYDKYVVYD